MSCLRNVALITLAASVSACQPSPRPERVSSPPGTATTVVMPVVPLAPAESSNADTCGAADFARFIGQDRKTLPAMPEGKIVRMLCTTCMRTMDFNGARLDIIYEAHSNIIRSVNCG